MYNSKQNSLVTLLVLLLWPLAAGAAQAQAEQAQAEQVQAEQTQAEPEQAAQAEAPDRDRDQDSDQDSEALTVEEILKRDPQLEDYVDSPRCISSHRIRSVEVLDNKHVAFRTGTDEYYLVQFQHRCPGLSKSNPVLYETRTNRLCVLDTIRGSYGVFGDIEPGPPCSIPSFQGITRESLLALKDALKAERKKARNAKR